VTATLVRATPLRVRWLGRVGYKEASDLQHVLRDSRAGDYLLLLEHPPVYTLGVRARREHLLASIHDSGAQICKADRGGDVTYHGPGQLVGYPVLDVPMGPGSVPEFVHRIEQLVIDALADLGLPGAGRLDSYPGVWVGAESGSPAKICAIGVRVDRGRSMHGFALNVDPDLSMFGHIIPCGIPDKAVTSIAAEGLSVSMRQVVQAVSARAAGAFSFGNDVARPLEEQGASWRTPVPVSPALPPPGPQALGAAASATGAGAITGNGRPGGRPAALEVRLRHAGVDPGEGLDFRDRKPGFVLAPVRMGPDVLRLRSMMRGLGLVTVCEEAGCPNLSECWAEGTATFMINGERCTRACGFCLVDTRHPLPLQAGEPDHVAAAVAKMGLAHAVVTAVARDDLADGGAAAFARTIGAIRSTAPSTTVEVLIPDCKGDAGSLRTIFDARPDVLNHNIETVLRLQRAVRPSASYARSLTVLGRAKRAGLVTKSGLILGMGETPAEVLATLADLRAVGVDIVTIGQYLRPSERHLPVMRWWTPAEFEEIGAAARAMGFGHVESSPLTRSSYHARRAAAGASARGGI
jgi:lipoic acid synthetase